MFFKLFSQSYSSFRVIDILNLRIKIENGRNLVDSLIGAGDNITDHRVYSNFIGFSQLVVEG
jgi:hypothetical protein